MIVVANFIFMVVGYVVSDQAHVWIDSSVIAMVVEHVGSWTMVGTLSTLTLLCSWGPGPVWLRSLALCLTTFLFCLQMSAVDYLLNSYFFLDFEEQILIAFAIVVTVMMILSLFAALGQWRIGPPSLDPIRIRIIDVMFGTAALAILFACSGPEDRSMTLILASVYAPIVAVVIAPSAWCLQNRYAWMPVLATLSILFAISYLLDPQGSTEYAIACAASSLAALWIAANVRLLGCAGWPLSRRRSVAKIGHTDT